MSQITNSLACSWCMLLQNDIFAHATFISVLHIHFGVHTCAQMPVRWFENAAVLSKLCQSGVGWILHHPDRFHMYGECPHPASGVDIPLRYIYKAQVCVITLVWYDRHRRLRATRRRRDGLHRNQTFSIVCPDCLSYQTCFRCIGNFLVRKPSSPRNPNPTPVGSTQNKLNLKYVQVCSI